MSEKNEEAKDEVSNVDERGDKLGKEGELTHLQRDERGKPRWLPEGLEERTSANALSLPSHPLRLSLNNPSRPLGPRDRVEEA